MSDQSTDQTIDDTTVSGDPTENTTDAVDQADTPEADTPDEGKEAAKYRRRLRETEKQRDALQEQVSALRRAAIDTDVQRTHRMKPDGFWATGITVDQLLDDDGNIDPAKVAANAADAVQRLGVQQQGRNVVPREGANPRPRGGDRFTEAFTPR
ncbi:hypothetical protein [Rhodococcus aetherivorans]|uniref:hypothetical protein n=1 Tax=Rhodococcus aetherivorans TaxID=191292 RepID=UPI0029496DDD|nr:hypothetical protein [Rhodococcus aetherivorans]MDV6291501.1 hypothetical protein [Rhodococcus aetherivorans]